MRWRRNSAKAPDATDTALIPLTEERQRLDQKGTLPLFVVVCAIREISDPSAGMVLGCSLRLPEKQIPRRYACASLLGMTLVRVPR